MLGTQNSALIIELTVNAPFMTDTTHASGKIRKVICGVVIGPFPELVNLKSADMDHSGVPLNRCQLKTLEHMRGVPPAQLALKVGARVVVTRNLYVSQGIVNGTLWRTFINSQTLQG